MRKKMLLGLMGIAMCLMLALSPITTAESPNSVSGVGDAGATFNVTISGEGTHYFNGGSDLASIGDRDKVVLKVTSKVKITVIVADCCIMGDTIAIFYPSPSTTFISAKSPNYILGSDVLSPMTLTFYIGYKSAPGGFPAGYYMWIIATHA